MRKNRLLKYVVTLLWGCLLGLHAQAVVVTGTATDLTDTVVGSDRWQLTYHLSGPLPSFYSVTLALSPSMFGDVTLMASPPASIDPSLVPPVDPLDNLLLTLTAQIDFGAGDSVDYSVFFNRLGALPFGVQSYVVADDGFSEIDGGRFTIAVASQPTNTVPEPASGWLFGLGIAAAVASRRWQPRAR